MIDEGKKKEIKERSRDLKKLRENLEKLKK